MLAGGPDPFLESPNNVSGQKSCFMFAFKIKVSIIYQVQEMGPKCDFFLRVSLQSGLFQNGCLIQVKQYVIAHPATNTIDHSRKYQTYHNSLCLSPQNFA